LPTTTNSATPSNISFGTSYADAVSFAKLQLKFYHDGTSAYGLGVSAGQLNIMSYTGGIHAFYNGATLVGQFNASGNLGVGVAPSSYKLDVNGTAHATSFPTSSDARFKKNIRPISGALEKIMNLRGVTYEWNEFINNTRDGYTLNTPVIGFIAQELEKVIPELVSTWKLDDQCQDARAIDYPRLTAMLVEAIKEQQNQINSIKARVFALESK
jgi:hypothetical protein